MHGAKTMPLPIRVLKVLTLCQAAPIIETAAMVNAFIFFCDITRNIAVVLNYGLPNTVVHINRLNQVL